MTYDDVPSALTTTISSHTLNLRSTRRIWMSGGLIFCIIGAPALRPHPIPGFQAFSLSAIPRAKKDPPYPNVAHGALVRLRRTSQLSEQCTRHMRTRTTHPADSVNEQIPQFSATLSSFSRTSDNDVRVRTATDPRVGTKAMEQA
ncbi:hypothetical protein NMY22_g11601 [Coprinellus aureogranulatus]|nr:hypothetical protein NMY22_g11601 [Coprinellus aureogranulatus]